MNRTTTAHPHSTRRRSLLSSLLLTTLSAVSVTPSLTSQTPTTTTPPRQKLLVLGNSITKHGPKADIGWTGNWGMAASAEDRDFSHLIAAGLGKATDLQVKNIADFERGFATYTPAEKLKEVLEWKPDIIVVAIGENVPQLTTDELKAQFKASLTALLKTLQSASPTTIVVRSCFWANPAKDEILKACAHDAGTRFADISTLAKDESNYARSERPYKHEGVARHPGDKGMQAIATAILKALSN